MKENTYDDEVFLADLLASADYAEQRIWREHQQMQWDFLCARGLTPDSIVLDLGCGPLRLGVRLISQLRHGWYFGVDINERTLGLGRRVLDDAGVRSDRYTLMASGRFDLSPLDRRIDLAFSNSLFSHLNLNSILLCLLQVRRVLVDQGAYYSTAFLAPDATQWLQPIERDKWGTKFHSFPDRDPYHYAFETLSALAALAGFSVSVDADFGHPTQTMLCFKPV